MQFDTILGFQISYGRGAVREAKVNVGASLRQTARQPLAASPDGLYDSTKHQTVPRFPSHICFTGTCAFILGAACVKAAEWTGENPFASGNLAGGKSWGYMDKPGACGFWNGILRYILRRFRSGIAARRLPQGAREGVMRILSAEFSYGASPAGRARLFSAYLVRHSDPGRGDWRHWQASGFFRSLPDTAGLSDSRSTPNPAIMVAGTS